MHNKEPGLRSPLVQVITYLHRSSPVAQVMHSSQNILRSKGPRLLLLRACYFNVTLPDSQGLLEPDIEIDDVCRHTACSQPEACASSKATANQY